MDTISISTHLFPEFNRYKTQLESKLKFDPVTYKHSLNVARYSSRFVKFIGCSIDSSVAYYSGFFHDIGKTEIDNIILQKNGSLNSSEYAEVKKHVSIGHKILQKAKLPAEISSAALYHHEKFNGSGYPYGLKKYEIPLIARIISICDVFDALTSDRPYRNGYPIKQALDIMYNSKDMFDKDLLPLFFLSLDPQITGDNMYI